MTPRLLLLDACGVIINDPLPGLLGGLALALHEAPHETIARYGELRQAFWTGRLDEAMFWRELTCGRGPELWSARLAAAYTPGPAVPHLAAWSQRARLRVLSNHRSAWMDRHLRRFDLAPFFERVVVSEAIGFIKPQPEAFLAALNDADLPLEAVLFIDDKQRNVEAALSLGMQAILAEPGLPWLTEVDARFGI